MDKFFLSTDSTADLYAHEIKELRCGFLPLTITVQRENGTELLPDSFTTEKEYYDFYELLKDRSVTVTTSKNNTEIHREYFERLAKEGYNDVLHFTISYGLANTLDNAEEAGQIVK